MVVHVAGEHMDRDNEFVHKLRKDSAKSGDVVVVIYVNGEDERSQTGIVAGLVDEIQRRVAQSSHGPSGRPPLVVADLTMDCERHEVTRGARTINLSPMEFSLLEHFLRNRDRVQTESELMDSVFRGSKDGGFNSLWVHIHRLRRKIDEGFPVRLLHTIRGVGYILKTPNHTKSKAG